jgi:tetratricopeptide (TPR) repeat protein
VFAAVLLVMAQAASGGWSGARPAECAPLASRASSNVWERAKSPELRRYCDLLASGAAKLATAGGGDEAREALAIAEQATAVLPGFAAPGVLRGRALARLGRWSDASAALSRAKSQDEHALDDPAALLALGRSLGRTGDTRGAEGAFRALLPKVAGLPLADRGGAEVEAALLALSRGPEGLDVAIAVLRQARRDAEDAMQTMVAMTLGLALDRAEQREEAHLILKSAAHADPNVTLADPRVRNVLLDVGSLPEGDALAAIVLESSAPSAARDAWGRYLAGPGGKGPWADHARSHRARGPQGAR